MIGSACPWLSPTNEDDVMECGDGTRCNGAVDGWSCCSNHNKRTKCPKNNPMMCESPKCGSLDDRCCRQECTKYQGQRTCGKYISERSNTVCL